MYNVESLLQQIRVNSILKRQSQQAGGKFFIRVLVYQFSSLSQAASYLCFQSTAYFLSIQAVGGWRMTQSHTIWNRHNIGFIEYPIEWMIVVFHTALHVHQFEYKTSKGCKMLFGFGWKSFFTLSMYCVNYILWQIHFCMITWLSSGISAKRAYNYYFYKEMIATTTVNS